MDRKKLKVLSSFEALDEDQLVMTIESVPSERWKGYWKLRKLHASLFFGTHEELIDPNAAGILILSKQMDVEDVEFLQFIRAAASQGLEYMLIGGLAMAMNGIARYTQDADVWIRPTHENKDRFVKTLVELGYDQVELAKLREANFTEAQHIRLAGPIDVLTVVHFRMEYDACRSRASEFRTEDGQVILFIHINDLRELKLLARRPKDLQDVMMIDALLERMRKKPGTED